MVPLGLLLKRLAKGFDMLKCAAPQSLDFNKEREECDLDRKTEDRLTVLMSRHSSAGRAERIKQAAEIA
jgi:hypothetical protein